MEEEREIVGFSPPSLPWGLARAVWVDPFRLQDPGPSEKQLGNGAHEY